MINIMIDRLIMFNAGQVRIEQKEEIETVSKQQDKRSRDSFVFVIGKPHFGSVYNGMYSAWMLNNKN